LHHFAAVSLISGAQPSEVEILATEIDSLPDLPPTVIIVPGIFFQFDLPLECVVALQSGRRYDVLAVSGLYR